MRGLAVLLIESINGLIKSRSREKPTMTHLLRICYRLFFSFGNFLLKAYYSESLKDTLSELPSKNEWNKCNFSTKETKNKRQLFRLFESGGKKGVKRPKNLCRQNFCCKIYPFSPPPRSLFFAKLFPTFEPNGPHVERAFFGSPVPPITLYPTQQLVHPASPFECLVFWWKED